MKKFQILFVLFFFFAASTVAGCTSDASTTSINAHDSIAVAEAVIDTSSSDSVLSVPDQVSEGKTLTIIGSKYPVRLVKGDGYLFPKLSGYGMQLVTTQAGYTLMDTSKSGSGTTIITSDGNGNTVTIITGNNRNFNIINGEVYENGKRVEPSKSSPQEKKTLVIQVPQGSNVVLDGNGQFRLTAEVPLGEVAVDLSGQSGVTLQAVAHVTSVDLSGQSRLSIQKVGVVDRVDVSGQSKLTLTEATTVTRVDISGQSGMNIPSGTTIVSQNVTGQSSIDRH